MRRNLGFTLIELLIAIALIIVSATVIVTIITVSFQGSTKTLVNEEVRQVGNTALAQVGKMIQYADSFVGVTDLEGNSLTSCTSSDTDVSYSSITFKIDGTNRTLMCEDAGFTLDGDSLIKDDNLVLENCEITCSQSSSTDAPTIGINFDLSKTVSGLPEQSINIDTFRKKIKMRNLNQ